MKFVRNSPLKPINYIKRETNPVKKLFSTTMTNDTACLLECFSLTRVMIIFTWFQEELRNLWLNFHSFVKENKCRSHRVKNRNSPNKQSSKEVTSSKCIKKAKYHLKRRRRKSKKFLMITQCKNINDINLLTKF